MLWCWYRWCFRTFLSDIMSTVLDLLSIWATVCDLGVNPSKTAMVLISTKSQIPSFSLPRLMISEFPLSRSAKYLGILYSKLSWKLYIEHRFQKATVAYYTCRKMFGSQWCHIGRLAAEPLSTEVKCLNMYFCFFNLRCRINTISFRIHFIVCSS